MLIFPKSLLFTEIQIYTFENAYFVILVIDMYIVEIRELILPSFYLIHLHLSKSDLTFEHPVIPPLPLS